MHASSVVAINPTGALALLIGLPCVAATAAANAAVDQMYECDQDGTVTFSDQPCTGPERIRDIQYDQPSGSQTNAAETVLQDENADSGAVAQADVLDTEILKTEQEISRLQIERTARLAEMREQRRLGSEDRDRAAWLQQMDQKMESTYQDYSARIITATDRLNELKARRAALGGGSPGPE
jgi:hypothetical protein